MSKVSSGSLRLSGNAFETDGLATSNARQPKVLRRHHTVKNTWSTNVKFLHRFVTNTFR